MVSLVEVVGACKYTKTYLLVDWRPFARFEVQQLLSESFFERYQVALSPRTLLGEAPRRVKAPGLQMDSSEDHAMQSVVHSRHKMLNGRFKFWEILKQPLRHNISEHGQIFRAIAVIIQLGINEGDKLFLVVYSD